MRQRNLRRRKTPIHIPYSQLNPIQRTHPPREVWSSTEISFRVSPINTAKPSFLFSLTGLLTPELAHIQNLVANTWKDPVTEAFVKNLVNRALPWQQHQLSIEIDNFINSLTVMSLFQLP